MSGNPRRQHVILVSIDVLLLCRLAGLSALAVQELPEYPTLVFGAGEKYDGDDFIVVFGMLSGLFVFLFTEECNFFREECFLFSEVCLLHVFFFLDVVFVFLEACFFFLEACFFCFSDLVVTFVMGSLGRVTNSVLPCWFRLCGSTLCFLSFLDLVFALYSGALQLRQGPGAPLSGEGVVKMTSRPNIDCPRSRRS